MATKEKFSSPYGPKNNPEDILNRVQHIRQAQGLYAGFTLLNELERETELGMFAMEDTGG